MLPLWQVGVFSFVLGLSGALMPGPIMTRVFQRAPVSGIKTGILISVGHGLSEVVFSSLLLWGVISFISEGWWLGAVSLAGAGVLAVMGGLTLIRLIAGRSAALPGKDGAASRSDATARKGVTTEILSLIGAGVLLSVINPYWTLWWVTLGVPFLVMKGGGWHGYLVFLPAHVSSDVVVFGLLSYLVSRGFGGRLGGPWYRWIEGVCGAAFLVFAAMFATYGIGKIGG